MSQSLGTRLRGGMLAVGLSLIGTTALAVPIIDTRPQVGSVGYIGESANANAFGQTFVPTGAETVLDTFTIWVDDVSSTPSLSFQGLLYSWDGDANQVVGDPLYESETMSSSVTGEFEEFTFTPGLLLVPDQTYIFFVTGVATGTPAFGQRGTPAADNYSGGSIFFTSGPIDSPWDNPYGSEDLTVVATFSTPAEPGPEPGTLFLLGGGLLLIGRTRRWIDQAPR